jgi:hypothetical protein
VSIKTDVILIPYWVHEALKRNGMVAADCLNFKKLGHILSSNDMILLATLQNSVIDMAGMRDDSGMLPGNFQLADQWRASLNTNDVESRAEIDNILCMVGDPSFSNELTLRLFDADSRQEQYTAACIKYDLSPTAVGMVIYPGYFSPTTPVALQLNFVTTVLSALYVYNDYHEVARTAWFKRQLELLSL